jgi:hypothetical protein
MVKPGEPTIALPQADRRNSPLDSKWLLPGMIVGLLLTTAVHLATFLPWRFRFQLPLIVVLYGGMFAALGTALMARKRSLPGGDDSEEPLLGYAPWLVVASVCCAAYAVVNFFICLAETREGLAVEQARGSYAIIQHGQIVRALTESEYVRKQTVQLRMFTGAGPYFYAVALAILISAQQRVKLRTQWLRQPHPPPIAGRK